MKKFAFLFSMFLLGMNILLAEDIKVGYLKYTVNADNTVTLSDAKKVDGSLIIPEEILNKKGNKFIVSSIGKEAFKGSRITSVEIPNTINSIGEGCFMNCKDLKSILLPTSITIIPEKAFSNCTSLNSFIIPGASRIEKEAFYGCTSLENISIPSNVFFIDSKAFYNIGDIKTFVLLPSANPIEVMYDILGKSKVNQLTIGRNWNGYPITSSANYIILKGDVTYVSKESVQTWQRGQVRNIKIETADWVSLANKLIQNSPTTFSASFSFDNYQNVSLSQARKTIAELALNQRKDKEITDKANAGDPEAIVNLFKKYYDQKKYNEALQYLKQLNEKGSDGLKLLGKYYSDAINCCLDCKEDELASYIFGIYLKHSNSLTLKQTLYPQFQFVDNDCKYCYYGSEGVMLLKYLGNSTNFTIPSSIKDRFGKERNVEILGDSCCYEASFTSVLIPSTVTKIGMVAFYGCKNLTKVKIESDKFIISGLNTFKKCDKLKWDNINYPYFKTEEITSDFGNALNKINYTFGYDITIEYVKSWITNHTAKQCYQAAEKFNTSDGFYESYLVSYVTKYLLLKKAVSSGDTDAQIDLCGVSSQLIRGYRVNSSIMTSEEAKQYTNTFIQTAKALAAKGNASGLYYMGWAYEFGFGVGVSKSQAHSYYAKARDKGVRCDSEWRRTRFNR